jgi:anti-sigma B factor antagonist
MKSDDEKQMLKEEMLSVRVMNGENSVFIALKGEVDVSTAPELLESIHAAFERNPMSIVLDVAELAYVDSVGLGVLVIAYKRAQAVRTAFFLSSPTRRVLRLLEVTGLKEVLCARQIDFAQ